jgi:membrane-bound lytic murein transglycosylase D
VFDRLLRLKDGSFLGDDGFDAEASPAQPGLAGEPAGAAASPQAQRSVTLLRGH